MGYFNGILRQKDATTNTEEVIQTYANRLQHAVLLADRKSAVKGLKSFSKTNREVVVQHGLRALLVALDKDHTDTEAVKAVLETLLVLFLRGEASEDQAHGWISNHSRLQNGKYPLPLLMDEIEIDQFSVWIADEILSSDAHVHTMLTVLQEQTGFQIRLYLLQLLEALVAARPARAKESLINTPLAVSTIVQLLAELNDPIRNETIVLLMALVNNNFNVQKLVAFENTFERIFAIIDEEGGIRGSIVVQDCLTLLTNLLQYNASNQKLFLETECVPRLARLIAEPIDDASAEELRDDHVQVIPMPPIVWTDQRLQNMTVLLEICRLFLDPDSAQVRQSQKLLEKSGIFYTVLRLIFAPVMEMPVRRTALQVAGDIMADNAELQLGLLQLDVPYIDPSLPVQLQRYKHTVPAPLALVNWALLTNSVHTFELRLAAAHCLACFFRNNIEAKLAFLGDQMRARTNPDYYHELQRGTHADGASFDPTAPPAPVSNVFSTLMDLSTDVKLNPYSVWFAASILVSVIRDCPEARALALSVTDGDADDGQEVFTLVQAVAGMLTAHLDAADPRVAIGCLMLLSVWMYDDSDPVDQFLADESIIKSVLAFLAKNAPESPEIVHGLATVLVGIVYEFSTATSPVPRASLYELVIKALGADNYAAKVRRLKENVHFKNFDDSEDRGFARDSTGLPMVYFIPEYVHLVKDNFYVIRRALLRGPECEPRARLSHEKFDLLKAENAAFAAELQTQRSDAERLQQDLARAVENARADHAAAAELLRTCQAELDAQRAAHKQAAEEYLVKYQALVQTQTKNDDASKKTERALADAENARAKAEAGINKMSRELFALDKQKANADARVAVLERTVAKAEADHERAVRELQEQIARAGRTNEEARAKIASLERGEGLVDRQHADARELQSQLANSDAENATLLEKLRTAAGVVQDLRRGRADAELRVAAFQRELEETYDALEESTQLLDEMAGARDRAQEPAEDLAELRGALRAEVVVLRNVVPGVHETRPETVDGASDGVDGTGNNSGPPEADEKQLLSDTMQVLGTLRKRLEQQQEQNEKLREQLREPRAETLPEDMPLGVPLDDKQEELARAHSRIARLEGNIEALSVSARQSLALFQSSSDALQSRVDELEAAKVHLGAEMDALRAAHTQELAARDDAYEELEGAFFDLELLLANIETSKQKLEAKYSQMKTDYLVKIEQLQDDLQVLRKAVADVTADRDAVGSEFAQLERLSNSIESKLKAKDALLQAMADKGADLAAKDAIVGEIKQRLASVIAQLGEAALKHRVLTRKNDELSKQHAAVEAQLRTRDERVAVLEQQVQRQSDADIQAQANRKKLAALQMERVQSVEVCEKQRGELASMRMQVGEMEQHVRRALRQLEDERRIHAEAAVAAVLTHTAQVLQLEESITRTVKIHDSDLRMLEASAESRRQLFCAENSALRKEIAVLKSALDASHASDECAGQTPDAGQEEQKEQKEHRDLQKAQLALDTAQRDLQRSQELFRLSEEQVRLSDEKLRLSEEKLRVLEQQLRSAEHQCKTTEEKLQALTEAQLSERPSENDASDPSAEHSDTPDRSGSKGSGTDTGPPANYLDIIAAKDSEIASLRAQLLVASTPADNPPVGDSAAIDDLLLLCEEQEKTIRCLQLRLDALPIDGSS